MRSIVAVICLLVATFNAHAQTWSGTTPGSIYYNVGGVGIGTSSPQQKFVVSNNGAEGLEIYLAQPVGVVGLQTYNRSINQYTPMRFDASRFAFMGGNVGIGTDNPQQKLDVLGKLRIGEHSQEYADIYYQLADVGETDYNPVWPAQHERALMFKPRGYLDGWGAGGAGIQFYTYDITGGTSPNFTGGYRRAMVIRRNGHIGIGTASPSHMLDVEGTAKVKELRLDAGSANFSGDLRFHHQGILRGRFLTGQSGNNGDLFYETSDASGNFIGQPFVIKNATGNVGIGTTSPVTKLDVRSGYISARDNDAVAAAFMQGGTGVSYFGSLGTSRVAFGNSSNWEMMTIATNGNVGIGTANPGTFKLAVEGNVGARKVVVTQIQPFPDYVFEPTYKLPTLQEVEAFIKAHKHLPDVPSAKEVGKKGLDLGDNQAVLLKKIEELTLYAIEANKNNTRLEEQNQKQQELIEKMEERLKRLEAKLN